MKFDRIVLQVHIRTHRLTESDILYDVTLLRWRPWRTPAFRCCIHRLPASPPSTYDAIDSLYARQVLIYSTLYFFYCNISYTADSFS